MDIVSIKKLINKGDIPQARSQLREVLAKTPEDVVAQMLYGTCCQIMGDSATFGRIYRELAPEMELRVTRGEKSERVSMWLKYAAMFAIVFTCFYVSSGADISPTAPNMTNTTQVVSVKNGKDLYVKVKKMSQRDRMLYFLQRPEVNRELHKGDAHAVVIPLQDVQRRFDHEEDDEGGAEERYQSGQFRVDNILLIRTSNSLKIGSEVVKALKAHVTRVDNDDEEDEDEEDEMFTERKRRQKRKRGQSGKRDDLDILLTHFSSFRQAVGTGEMNNRRRVGFHEAEAEKKVLQTVEERGDISDLIVSLDGPDSHVLGVCFVNICWTGPRSRYMGPRDYGDRFPKYIIAPDGTVLYDEKFDSPKYGGPSFNGSSFNDSSFNDNDF